MKKTVLLLAVLILFAFTGCGRKAQAPAETLPPVETEAPAETPAPTPEPWVPGDTPPLPTCSGGAEACEAIPDLTYSWHYVDDEGKNHDFESSGPSPQLTDWLDGTYPILRAEGEVRISFPCRMPDHMNLSAFSPKGAIPVELREGAFTPYAGVNAYLLSVSWKRGKPVTRSQARYILLVEGTGPAELPETEAGISLTLLEADARGCVFTLENQRDKRFFLAPRTGGTLNGGYYALFRRTETGAWEWMKPRRFPMESIPEWPAGSSQTAEVDWSWSQGTLEPGEYAVLFSGGLVNGTSLADDRIFLTVFFTLGPDELPEPPGPLTLCEAPKGLSAVLEQRSPHRWTQTVTSTGEIPCAVDRNVFLFRKEETGTLTYIQPEYTLPSGPNSPLLLSRAGSQQADVELAALCGELEAGDYVLRRRVYLMESPVLLDTVQVRSQRIPSDRIVYLDTGFTLTAPLSAVPLNTDPCPLPFYDDPTPDPVLPVSAPGSVFDAYGCRLQLENRGEQPVSFSFDYVLYFLWEEEWLPLENNEPGWTARFPEQDPLQPGESRELTCVFSPWYDPLEPGTYRLVMRAGYPDENEYGAKTTRLTADFAIREDGTGTFLGD